MQAEFLAAMPRDMFEALSLENGLTLTLYDRSRSVAGDRWLVSFEARIELEVLPGCFAGDKGPAVSFEDIKAAVGEKVVYRYTKQRNFVAQKEKGSVFKELKTHFLSLSLPYLASPEFPRKLILSQYFEAIGKRRGWKKH
jgi:hypothetical protein